MARTRSTTRGGNRLSAFGDNGGAHARHARARSLTDAEFTPAQADAITNAVRLAAEQGDHVTSDQFKAGLAEVRTEIAEVRTEIAALDTRLSTQGRRRSYRSCEPRDPPHPLDGRHGARDRWTDLRDPPKVHAVEPRKALEKTSPEAVVEWRVQYVAKASASEISDVGCRLQEDVDELGAPADRKRHDLWPETIRSAAQCFGFPLVPGVEVIR